MTILKKLYTRNEAKRAELLEKRNKRRISSYEYYKQLAASSDEPLPVKDEPRKQQGRTLH